MLLLRLVTSTCHLADEHHGIRWIHDGYRLSGVVCTDGLRMNQSYNYGRCKLAKRGSQPSIYSLSAHPPLAVFTNATSDASVSHQYCGTDLLPTDGARRPEMTAYVSTRLGSVMLDPHLKQHMKNFLLSRGGSPSLCPSPST